MHKCSQCARSCSQRRAGQPWGAATEESLWRTPLGKPAAVCPCSASWAWPLGCHPQAPVPASPAASLHQRNILAFAHCLLGTKTDFQLPFPLSETNKWQCFKSEAFIRPCIPQVISFSSIELKILWLPKKAPSPDHSYQELGNLCTPLGLFKVNQHHCSPSIWFLIWIYCFSFQLMILVYDFTSWMR